MGSRTPTSPTATADPLAACQGVLGHRFSDPTLLQLALTHASAKAAGLPSNERLEFLGDAILGAIVSEYLYLVMPDSAEGELTRTRSLVVSSRALARACREAGIQEFLTLGKGIRSTKTLPQSLLANAMEAVLGAVYLDAGLKKTRTVAMQLLKDEIQTALAGNGQRNFKAMLQHLAQTELRTTPTYRVVAEEGPAHTRTFSVVAVVGDQEFPAARGRSKKAAEQAAAKRAYAAITSEPDDGNGRAVPAKRRPTTRSKKKPGTKKAAAKPAPKPAPKPNAKRA